jgi:hypothetical protein
VSARSERSEPPAESELPALRFRHSPAVIVAAVVACFGAAFTVIDWYLAPIVLIPLAVAVWGWRSGTDVDSHGVRVRALVASRFVAWDRIHGFLPSGRRVIAVLADGRAVALPAVGPADLANLVARSGHPLG